MIYFLTLLCSMCIQFSTVNPFNMAELNTQNIGYISDVKDMILNNKGGYWGGNPWFNCLNVPDDRWVVVKGFYGGADSIIVLCPREDIGDGSSSIACNRYTQTDDVVDSVSLNFYNYFGFHYTDNSIESDLSIFGYYNYNFSGGAGSLLYCATPIYNESTLVVDSFNNVPELSGHTQSGKNDKIIDQLPFPNAPTISGHSSVSTVDDTSTNNLLGNILNTLQVIGNTVTTTGNNIITFISDLYGNINDTINYVIEPLDHEEVIDIMKNSHYNGLFEDLKNVKDSFDNLSNSDHVILSFTLPAYLGGDTFSFDFAQYFNSSKHIWQPLLLTFLYASLVWGFYKGFANMVNGSSPFVSDVHYQFANDRIQSEQASDNHTR